MDEDRIGLLVGVLRAGERAPLQALAGELHRRLVGRLGERQPLHADVQPRAVHEGEHPLHPLVRLADEEALGAVEVDDAGGRRLDPHLVLDRAAGDAIRDELAPLFAHLRDDEEADPLDAGRGIGEARQHQVDDVLGQVVLAAGDEDLAAGEAVGALETRRRIDRQRLRGHALDADQRQHFAQHHGGDDDAHRQIADETLAHGLGFDVQHHHHEQEQHHDRADVDQHQGDGEELGFQQQPQAGAGEEGQHQGQGRMHRVARGDDAQGRQHQDGGEEVENEALEFHGVRHRYLASSARSRAICSSYLSPTARSMSLV